MLKPPASPRAMPTRAERAAAAIAKEGAWKIDILGTPVAPRFAHHLYVESAALVILPTGKSAADMMAVMNPVMREARCDALIVSVPHDQSGKIELAIGIWRSTEINRFIPMALWRSETGLWIVPDPYHSGVRRECFQIRNGRLRPTRAPWVNKVDELHGLMRADAWMIPVIS